MDERTLITETLANAARAPYYARTWGDAWRSIENAAQMAALPLLDKTTAIEHQRELIVGDAPAGFGIASSGTTRGADRPALNVLRSDEDNAQLFGAHGAPASIVAPHPRDPHPGWTLVVVGVHHGLPPNPPAPDELRVPWMYHRNALSMIEACIAQPQPDGRRVTAMRISAGALKTVTAWFLERGKTRDEMRAFGVRMIGTNGSRVSAHWRALIADLFGAELYDNFSLSEIPTPATECKACGALHFQWPPVLYEVIDLVTGAPVPDGHDGVGKLVVTTLAPWVTKMPLVRYDTGDVVSLAGTCAQTGQPRVVYLGRARRGVIVEEKSGAVKRGAFVLAPAFVQDVLEALAVTERNPHPAVTNGLVKMRELGLPRFTVEHVVGAPGGIPREPDIARLRFEVRFDPRVHASDARAVEEHVRAELLRADTELSRTVTMARVKLEIEACAPGSVDPPADKFE